VVLGVAPQAEVDWPEVSVFQKELVQVPPEPIKPPTAIEPETLLVE
jgi:hypothetical protein